MPKFFRKIDRETVLYVLFGTLTAAVNLSVYFVLNWTFRVNYMVSNISAWVATVLFAYVTNKLFVFRTKSGSWKELGREFVRFVNSRIISGGAGSGADVAAGGDAPLQQLDHQGGQQRSGCRPQLYFEQADDLQTQGGPGRITGRGGR